MYKSKRNRKYKNNKKGRKISNKGGGILSALSNSFSKNTSRSTTNTTNPIANADPDIVTAAEYENDPIRASLRQAKIDDDKNGVVHKPIVDSSLERLAKTYTKYENDLLNKQKKAAGILHTIETKNEMNILFMINCCVLYNVYIDVDKTNNTNKEHNTIQLYQEELKTIGKELDDIFNDVRNTLNDFFMTNSFGKSHYLFDDTKKSEETIDFNEIIADLIKPSDITSKNVQNVKQKEGSQPVVENAAEIIDKLNGVNTEIEGLANTLIEKDTKIENDSENANTTNTATTTTSNDNTTTTTTTTSNSGDEIIGGFYGGEGEGEDSTSVGNTDEPVQPNKTIMALFTGFFQDIKDINIIKFPKFEENQEIQKLLSGVQGGVFEEKDVENVMMNVKKESEFEGKTDEQIRTEIRSSKLDTVEKIRNYVIDMKKNNLLQNFKIEGNSLKYLLFVYFFTHKIRMLYKEAIGKIGETGPEGKKIIYQAKVVMAKQKILNELTSTKDSLKSLGKSVTTGISKGYNTIKNLSFRKKGGSKKRRTLKKKIGAGLFNDLKTSIGNKASNLKTSIKNKASNAYTAFSHIPTMAYEFVKKRDPKITEKYTYLFYFNSFLTMYKDNLLVSRSVQEGYRSLRDLLRDSLLGAYRFAKKNPMLSIFYGTLTLATQIVFYASIAYPPLVPFAAGLTLTHKIVALAILPIIVPAAIAIYKSSEITSYNESMISIIGKEFTESRLKQIKKIEEYLSNKEITNDKLFGINKNISLKEGILKSLPVAASASADATAVPVSTAEVSTTVPSAASAAAASATSLPTALPVPASAASAATAVSKKLEEDKQTKIKDDISKLRYDKLKALQEILNTQLAGDKNIEKFKEDINNFIKKYQYQNSLNGLIFKYRNEIQTSLLQKGFTIMFV